MKERSCRELADLLPDHVAGRLAVEESGRMERHLRACADCAAELVLLRALAASRPAVPSGLAARISAAALADRAPGAGPRGRPHDPDRRTSGAPGWRRRLRPAWALPVAAALVLALGTALLREAGRGPSGLGEVAVDDPSEVWLGEEGVVAGAPVLDELSDEVLVTLLAELEQ